MKIVKVRISKDEKNFITVKDGWDMHTAFIDAFNIPTNGEVNAKMKIYNKGKIVIETTKEKINPIEEIGFLKCLKK